MQYIEGYYNYQLVALSVLAAMIAAIIALDLSAFALEIDEKHERRKWLVFASLALGIGIWTMHFIGMLAFQLPIPVHYDGSLTFLSLVISVVGCLFGFSISFKKFTPLPALVGGLSMGSAITAMHYTGMAAMHMPAKMVYEPYMVGLSGLIAIGASTASLFIMSSPKTRILNTGFSYKLGGAILMGLAISGMHYTGMAATSFIPGKMASMEINGFRIEGISLILPLVLSTSFLIILPLFAKDVVNRKALKMTLETEYLRKSETRLRKLIEYLGDAVVVINTRGIIKLFNKSATTLFGYTPDEVMGKNISMLMHGADKKAHNSYVNSYVHTGHSVLIDTGPRPVEALLKNGQVIPVEIIISDAGEGSDNRFIGIIRDISAQAAEMDRLTNIANYDQLTGLCNRNLYYQNLQHAISLAKRQQNILAVMFLDLDEFKAINDNFGHEAGDELLRKVAALLLQNVRESDTVARLGGDEFCILIEGINDPVHPAMLSKKILRALSKPVRVGDNNLKVTSSIGIALFPEDGNKMEALIKNADTAMYLAKSSGKNQYKFYDKSIIL